MRKAFEIGGIVAAVVLIAFGIGGAVAMGINGRSTVQSNLGAGADHLRRRVEGRDGSGEVLRAAREYRRQGQGVRADDAPSHARGNAGPDLLADGPLRREGGTPAKLTDGQGGTNDPMYAATDAKGSPVSNSARDLWVTRPR